MSINKQSHTSKRKLAHFNFDCILQSTTYFIHESRYLFTYQSTRLAHIWFASGPGFVGSSPPDLAGEEGAPLSPQPPTAEALLPTRHVNVCQGPVVCVNSETQELGLDKGKRNGMQLCLTKQPYFALANLTNPTKVGVGVKLAFNLTPISSLYPTERHSVPPVILNHEAGQSHQRGASLESPLSAAY